MVSTYSETEAASQLASVLPRVLIVSRRTVRKNKFVDFVGEYHLDLIVNYGAVPVIVPRVSGVQSLLDSFEPIHGVLLCEGEDVDASLYNDEDEGDLSQEELPEIRRLHCSDTAIDKAKDSIELQLARRCLERNIPYLGICRGSQLLNVACGGTLYQDVEKELSKKSGIHIKHIKYDDYDGHRHPVKVVENTPLHAWFHESFQGDDKEIMVNSYHHQGVKRLAERFKPMAYAPDGLVEAFYDPNAYNTEEGQFIMGLQFHPERMHHDQDAAHWTENSSETVFDYPGCPKAYQEFVKAVVAFQRKQTASTEERGALKLDGEMEKQRRRIARSFSKAKLIYDDHFNNSMQKDGTAVEAQYTDSELAPGAIFLQLNTALRVSQLSTALNTEEEKRLKQMGATVRNFGWYTKKLRLIKEKKEAAANLMEAMSTEQLWDLVSFYQMMAQIGSKVLEERLPS